MRLVHGVALLGLTGLWFQARRHGHGGWPGEDSIIATFVACLMFVVGYAVFIAQGFDTAAAAYTLMDHGSIMFVISMLLHGLGATVGRLLALPPRRRTSSKPCCARMQQTSRPERTRNLPNGDVELGDVDLTVEAVELEGVAGRGRLRHDESVDHPSPRRRDAMPTASVCKPVRR